MAKRELSKCRVWEQERRNRLNNSFIALSKLLPCYDPSSTLSKIEILQKATTLVSELQNKNKEFLLGGTEPSEAKREEIKKLQERIKKLLTRNEQLANLLQTAGIRVPSECGTVKSFNHNKKWSSKVTPEIAENIVKTLSKNSSNRKPKSDLVQKKKKNITCVPKKKKKIVTPNENIDLNNKLHQQNKNGTIKKKISKNSGPTISTNKPNFTTTLGPGTLILADGRVLPVAPTSVPRLSTLTTPLLTRPNIITHLAPRTSTRSQTITTPSLTRPLVATTLVATPTITRSHAPPTTVILMQRARPVACKTGPGAKLPIPHLKKNITPLVRGQEKRNAKKDVKKKKDGKNVKLKNYKIQIDAAKNTKIIPTIRKLEETVKKVSTERGENGEIKKSNDTKTTNLIKSPESVLNAVKKSQNPKETSEKNKDNPKQCSSNEELQKKDPKNNPKEKENLTNIGTFQKDINNTIPEIVSEKVDSHKETILEKKSPSIKNQNDTEFKDENVPTTIEKSSKYDFENNINEITKESSPKDNTKFTKDAENFSVLPVSEVTDKNPENTIKTNTRTPEKITAINKNEILNYNILNSDKVNILKNSDKNKFVETNLYESIKQQKNQMDASKYNFNNDQLNFEKITNLTENSVLSKYALISPISKTDTEVANISEHHSELSNDIFATLSGPPNSGAHPESMSPTAAFLLAFPLVSTLTGTSVPQKIGTEVNNEENSDSRQDTPTLLQIGTMETTGTVSNSVNSKPNDNTNLISLDSFSTFFGQHSENCFGEKDKKERQTCENTNKEYNKNTYQCNTFNPFSDTPNEKYNLYPNCGFEYTYQMETCSKNPQKNNDKRASNKAPVNWMTTPDIRHQTGDLSSLPPFEFGGIFGNHNWDSYKTEEENRWSWSPGKILPPLVGQTDHGNISNLPIGNTEQIIPNISDNTFSNQLEYPKTSESSSKIFHSDTQNCPNITDKNVQADKININKSVENIKTIHLDELNSSKNKPEYQKGQKITEKNLEAPNTNSKSNLKNITQMAQKIYQMETNISKSYGNNTSKNDKSSNPIKVTPNVQEKTLFKLKTYPNGEFMEQEKTTKYSENQTITKNIQNTTKIESKNNFTNIPKSTSESNIQNQNTVSKSSYNQYPKSDSKYGYSNSNKTYSNSYSVGNISVSKNSETRYTSYSENLNLAVYHLTVPTALPSGNNPKDITQNYPMGHMHHPSFPEGTNICKNIQTVPNAKENLTNKNYPVVSSETFTSYSVGQRIENSNISRDTQSTLLTNIATSAIENLPNKFVHSEHGTFSERHQIDNSHIQTNMSTNHNINTKENLTNKLNHSEHVAFSDRNQIKSTNIARDVQSIPPNHNTITKENITNKFIHSENVSFSDRQRIDSINVTRDIQGGNLQNTNTKETVSNKFNHSEHVSFSDRHHMEISNISRDAQSASQLNLPTNHNANTKENLTKKLIHSEQISFSEGHQIESSRISRDAISSNQVNMTSNHNTNTKENLSNKFIHSEHVGFSDRHQLERSNISRDANQINIPSNNVTKENNSNKFIHSELVTFSVGHQMDTTMNSRDLQLSNIQSKQKIRSSEGHKNENLSNQSKYTENKNYQNHYDINLIQSASSNFGTKANNNAPKVYPIQSDLNLDAHRNNFEVKLENATPKVYQSSTVPNMENVKNNVNNFTNKAPNNNNAPKVYPNQLEHNLDQCQTLEQKNITTNINFGSKSLNNTPKIYPNRLDHNVEHKNGTTNSNYGSKSQNNETKIYPNQLEQHQSLEHKNKNQHPNFGTKNQNIVPKIYATQENIEIQNKNCTGIPNFGTKMENSAPKLYQNHLEQNMDRQKNNATMVTNFGNKIDNNAPKLYLNQIDPHLDHQNKNTTNFGSKNYPINQTEYPKRSEQSNITKMWDGNFSEISKNYPIGYQDYTPKSSEYYSKSFPIIHSDVVSMSQNVSATYSGITPISTNITSFHLDTRSIPTTNATSTSNFNRNIPENISLPLGHMDHGNLYPIGNLPASSIPNIGEHGNLPVPTTLPTLIGDLALGNVAPNLEDRKNNTRRKSVQNNPIGQTYDMPNTTFSVSHLVEPQKDENRSQNKRNNTGKTASNRQTSNKRKTECYRQNQKWSESKRFKNSNSTNYSAEALISDSRYQQQSAHQQFTNFHADNQNTANQQSGVYFQQQESYPTFGGYPPGFYGEDFQTSEKEQRKIGQCQTKKHTSRSKSRHHSTEIVPPYVDLSFPLMSSAISSPLLAEGAEFNPPGGGATSFPAPTAPLYYGRHYGPNSPTTNVGGQLTSFNLSAIFPEIGGKVTYSASGKNTALPSLATTYVPSSFPNS